MASTQPVIGFSQAAADGGPPFNSTATWNVASTSQQTYEFPSYRVLLMRGSQRLTPSPQRLQADALLSLGLASMLIVRDLDGNGNLTVGDIFSVYGLEGSYSWNLTLWWSPQDIIISSARWDTYFTRPAVIFGAIAKDGNPPLNHSANWTVISVSTPLFDMEAYFVMMEINGTQQGWSNLSQGAVLWLDSSVRMIVRSSGGQGKLDAGTSFLVYGMAEPHGWRLSLRWKMDGSEIQSASWSTP